MSNFNLKRKGASPHPRTNPGQLSLRHWVPPGNASASIIFKFQFEAQGRFTPPSHEPQAVIVTPLGTAR